MNGYYEQDDGQDLMNLLEIYFLHVTGCLSGAFNVSCSIVVFIARVILKEFSVAGFRTHAM